MCSKSANPTDDIVVLRHPNLTFQNFRILSASTSQAKKHYWQ